MVAATEAEELGTGLGRAVAGDEDAGAAALADEPCAADAPLDAVPHPAARTATHAAAAAAAIRRADCLTTGMCILGPLRGLSLSQETAVEPPSSCTEKTSDKTLRITSYILITVK